MPATIFSDVLSAILQRRPWRGEALGRATGASMAELCRDLFGARGEISGAALAGGILETYRRLGAADRSAFFAMMAREFEIDTARCAAAAEACRVDPSPANLALFQRAAEPRRQELLRRLNLADGGTAALVRMRAELLELLPEHPELAPVDADFRHLFASWFNRGFLVFRQIDWSSPAELLEKIIEYEAVHEIRDWIELRRRVQPTDRLCFGFFHPAMPGEPLIVIEVALCMSVPASIGAILAGARAAVDPEQATVACFYSISNCQKGLQGISFGNLLIKQVAKHLAARFPRLRTFVTLSPVPGLSSWLRRMGVQLPEADGYEAFLADNGVRDTYLGLAARYLVEEKRKDGQPCDPVARFHLGNGAMLDALHWGGDPSAKGMTQSAGVMVNYLYDLDMIEKHHEAFVATGRVVASRGVAARLQKAKMKASVT